MALALVAGAARAGEPAAAEAWRRWRNTTIGFGIRYPDSVTPQLGEAAAAAARARGQAVLDGAFAGPADGAQFVLLLEPARSGRVTANLSLNTASGVRPPGGVGTAEFCRVSLERLPSVMEGAAQLGEVAPFLLGGRTWYRADFEFETSGVSVRVRSMLHHRGETMYTLTLVGAAQGFDGTLARAEPILATLSLNP